MDEKRKTVLEENRQTGIGTGKKVGLYGCGFLILATIVITIILILTGMYNPFVGTEGVGP